VIACIDDPPLTTKGFRPGSNPRGDATALRAAEAIRPAALIPQFLRAFITMLNYSSGCTGVEYGPEHLFTAWIELHSRD